MSVDIRKELTEIGKSVQEHQKRLGRVLTQEELDASNSEDKEERIKKYENMTPVEAAFVMEKEQREWEEKIKEIHGEDYLDFDFDEYD